MHGDGILGKFGTGNRARNRGVKAFNESSLEMFHDVFGGGKLKYPARQVDLRTHEAFGSDGRGQDLEQIPIVPKAETNPYSQGGSLYQPPFHDISSVSRCILHT